MLQQTSPPGMNMNKGKIVKVLGPVVDVEFPGTLTEKMVENFREEVAEIKAPAIKRLFVLSKAIQIAHWRIGEWVALVAAADVTGNFGVGVLLETCLAEDLAFAERTRRILRKVAEERIAARQAGK